MDPQVVFGMKKSNPIVTTVAGAGLAFGGGTQALVVNMGCVFKLTGIEHREYVQGGRGAGHTSRVEVTAQITALSTGAAVADAPSLPGEAHDLATPPAS